MPQEVLYNILDSIPDLSSYKSVTDRYFSRRYILNINNIEGNDIMLLFHSNRITLLTLAPSHLFFKKSGSYKINFSVGKVDRLNNTVSGKSKKGGQLLTPTSTVCKIEFHDNTCFDVPSGMKGTLVEVNEGLVEKPLLLRECPDSDGYIAIMLSSIALTESLKNELLTHEEYVKILQNRK